MKSRTAVLIAGMAMTLALASLAAPARAALITSPDIVPITGTIVGSGNGTLDLLLFTKGSGGAGNDHNNPNFNADDANTDLPGGNGAPPNFNGSFITSIGDLRAFYILNFPNGSGGSTVNQLVLFVDVNEQGGPQTINLDILDIFKDYTQNFVPATDARNNPDTNDVSSALQNSTGTGFSGGTQLRGLDTTPKVIGQTNTGGGHADAAIFTHINPFDPAFSDSTRLLFHVALSDLDNGAEAIFLDQKIGPQDVPGAPPPEVLPEPSGITLILLGGAALAFAARRRASRP